MLKPLNISLQPHNNTSYIIHRTTNQCLGDQLLRDALTIHTPGLCGHCIRIADISDILVPKDVPQTVRCHNQKIVLLAKIAYLNFKIGTNDLT
jgi:hypothetical protein